MGDPKSEKQGQGTPRKPRRGLRFVLRSLCYGLAVVAFSLALLLTWMIDRPIAAPDWLQTRIEAYIATQAPDMTIKFGAMVLTVQSGWRPMLELRDVRFEDTGGVELLSLSDLQATLAMRPLLDGLVQPRTVSMSGLFATLRRDLDGQVSVVVADEGAASTRQAATLPALVGQIDELFVLPELAALRTLEVGSVTLRFEDARARRAWTVDGARLQVQRDGQSLGVTADLALLSGGADVATMAANFSSEIGATAAEFGVTVTDVDARDVADFNPAFGWLDALRAPISGSLRGGMAEDGTLTPVNATLQINEGVLQPTGDTKPIPFQSARTYFSFDPSGNELVFDELSIVSAWGSGRAEGRATLTGIETGELEQLVGQIQIAELQLNPPGVYESPVTFDAAEMDFRLVPHPFRFDLGQMRIVDQGSSMRLTGALRAAPGGWDLALDGRMDAITPARLMELWPEAQVPRTRAWLATNIEAGQLRDLDVAVRSVPGSKPDTYLSFLFEDATVRYMQSLPPISQARGVGSLLRGRFALSLERGVVQAEQGGAVDVAGSSFIIPDVTVKGGAPAVVRLKTDSTATALLTVLDREPLRLMRNAGLPPDVASARAVAEATLTLPLRSGLTTDEVRFDVTADLRDVRSQKLVPERTLTAPRLRLTASNTGDSPAIEIVGQGAFDGIPFDATWRQALGASRDGSSRVTGTVEVSADALTALNVGLPSGMVRGSGPARLTLDLPPDGASPRFDLSSRLAGIGLRIPELGWTKAPGARGTLEVAGVLGTVPRVDRIRLDAAGLTAEGSVSVRPGGGLDEARFSRVRVGGWLDAPVILSGRGTGAAPAVRINGGSFDLRQAEFGSGSSSGSGGSGAGGPLTLALERLQITDTIALTDMRADFDLARGLQGRFLGKVNGGPSVTGQVVPQNGRSAFQINSDNAGAVFAAAGLLKQARGGKMDLLLSPVGTAGAFNGALRVNNTRVTDAPAMAALLNALSVVGLLEQMGGQGLHFQEVEAAFRLTPERVTVTQASATGPSIGLSLDGTYDVNTAQMDMQGVFSPIYLINGVGSLLTRKGEGLIGFNYTLKGPAAAPRVQVNPLSALTPSIFREIFRRPPPAIAVEPGEQPGAAPSVPRNGTARPSVVLETDNR